MATLHALREQIGTATILKEVVEIHRTISTLRYAMLKSNAEKETTMMAALNSILGAVMRHAGLRPPTGAPELLIAIASNRGLCNDYNALVQQTFDFQRKSMAPGAQTITIGETLAGTKPTKALRFPETGLGNPSTAGMEGEDPLGSCVDACLETIRQLNNNDRMRAGSWMESLPHIRIVLLPHPSVIPGEDSSGVAPTPSEEYRQALSVDLWQPIYTGVPHPSWIDENISSPEVLVRITHEGESFGALPSLWLPQAETKEVGGYDQILTTILNTYLSRRLSFLLYAAEFEENQRRMKATNSVAENIDKEIKRLKNDVNKTRQAMITRELTELISGAKAFKKVRLR